MLMATVMVRETTGRLQLIMPLMMTVFVAKMSARKDPISVSIAGGTVCSRLLQVIWVGQSSLHRISNTDRGPSEKYAFEGIVCCLLTGGG